jgi:hypothetical protein
MENKEKTQEKILRPDIALEMEKMLEVDQDMRAKAHDDPDFWDYEIDRKNTERIKEIVKEIGFPFISIVGEEGTHNAWLLIQHADEDVEFQRECLKFMKEAPSKEIIIKDIAYLDDRIRINSKQPQLYGTQFTQEGGKHIPLPIEDQDKVDERRAQMGMDTLADQIELMYEKYPLEKDKQSN